MNRNRWLSERDACLKLSIHEPPPPSVYPLMKGLTICVLPCSLSAQNQPTPPSRNHRNRYSRSNHSDSSRKRISSSLRGKANKMARPETVTQAERAHVNDLFIDDDCIAQPDICAHEKVIKPILISVPLKVEFTQTDLKTSGQRMPGK